MRSKTRKLAIFVVLLCVVGGTAQLAIAQDNLPQEAGNSGNSPIYDLNNLVLAKFETEEGNAWIVVDVPTFKDVERVVKVQAMRQENRTRMVTVTNADGEEEQVEQNFVVTVPFQKEVTVTKKEPAGSKPQQIALDELTLFSLDGKLVQDDVLIRAFKTVRSVFLVKKRMDVVPAASPTLQKTIGKNALVLTTDALGNEAKEPPGPQQVIAPAVARVAAVPLQPAVRAVLPAPAVAPPAFANPRARRVTNSRLFEPNNVVLAKLDAKGDAAKIVCMVNGFRVEEREGMITKFRTEERTRMVTVIVDGEPQQKEQTYSVSVPYQARGVRKVRVPAGKKPVTADWVECKLLRLDGTPLDLEQAKEALGKARPVFLWKGKDSEYQPPNEMYQQITEDALILLSDAKSLFP